MSPEWMQWIEENMPAAMLEEFKAAWRHEGNWRDNRIAALEAELADVKAELESVYSWAGCRQCHHDKTAMCDSCVVNNVTTKFSPKWIALAECGEGG